MQWGWGDSTWLRYKGDQRATNRRILQLQREIDAQSIEETTLAAPASIEETTEEN